jgi:hypothetical protein
MAAPFVAGVAALLLAGQGAGGSSSPSVASLKAALMDTASAAPELRGTTVSGGRLDATAAGRVRLSSSATVGASSGLGAMFTSGDIGRSGGVGPISALTIPDEAEVRC